MPADLASPGAVTQHSLDPVGAVLEVVQLEDLMLPAVLDEQAPSESLDQWLRRSLRRRGLVDEDAGRLSHLDRAQGRVLQRMVVPLLWPRKRCNRWSSVHQAWDLGQRGRFRKAELDLLSLRTFLLDDAVDLRAGPWQRMGGEEVEMIEVAALGNVSAEAGEAAALVVGGEDEGGGVLHLYVELLALGLPLEVLVHPRHRHLDAYAGPPELGEHQLHLVEMDGGNLGEFLPQ